MNNTTYPISCVTIFRLKQNIFVKSRKFILDKKYNRMTTKKILLKGAIVQDPLTNHQAQIDGNNSNTNWNQVFSMYPNEDTNQLEQKYYDKDRGCAVKAQADNIFEYKFWSKKWIQLPQLTTENSMKTEKQLNEGILKITMKIKEKFPELSKFILEMPVTIPILENPKINHKSLLDYYNSLKILLKNYIENQTVTTK